MTAAENKAVFLSYASQDADAARRICDALRASGVEVWFDQSELRGGDAWDQKIRRQIKECALFVPIISANTQARLEGYFRLEWKLADERTHLMAEGTPFLLPVTIDDTDEREAVAPKSFLQVQWTRFGAGDAARVFCERVKELLARFEQQVGRAAIERTRTVAVARPARPARANSIAVMPLENLSPDPDNAYFADGLTEELIADLSKVQALRVTSRTSAMHFRGAKKSVPEIAAALNVRYVLEGSVRRSGNKLRITAQLIDAATDLHLWSEKISATLEDIFDVQEQVSRRIIDALKVVLTPDENRRLSARPLPNTEAYDLWLRIRRDVWDFTPGSYERAIRLAEEATAIAGENALIHAALAYVYYWRYDSGGSYDDATLRRVGQHASRALELDSELSLAWLAAGLEQYKRGDFPRAASLLRRAVALDGNEDALGFLALILGAVGCDEEAQALAEELVARSPFYFLPTMVLGVVHCDAGRFQEAAKACGEFLARTNASEPLTTWILGVAEAYAGREAEALAQLRQVVDMRAGIVSDLCEFLARALMGDVEGARTWFATHPLFAQIAKTDEFFPINLATVFAHIGDLDRALEYLEYGVAWEFSCHQFLAEHNRFLAPLRGHPRFEAVLNKARAQQSAFRAVS